MATNNQMNIWNLSQTISHMKSVKDLDNRSVFITVHLKDVSNFEKLTRIIQSFSKEFCEKEKMPLCKVPGLFSCLDYEDSKKGIINRKFPHIHALLVFAQQYPKGVINEFIKELSDFLNQHPLVNTSFKNPVEITRFEDRKAYKRKKKDQIENLIDYCRKNRLSDKRDAKTLVLPYEDIIELDNLSSDKIAKSARNHFDNFCNNKNMQDYYSSV